MANEKRLIDANALIEALPIVTEDRKITLYGAVADFMIMISAMPTVDAVEVVHGRWEDMHDGKYANPRFRCSVCKEKSLFKDERNVLGNWIQVQALTPFCPHCGAALGGGKGDDI